MSPSTMQVEVKIADAPEVVRLLEWIAEVIARKDEVLAACLSMIHPDPEIGANCNDVLCVTVREALALTGRLASGEGPP